MFPTIDIFNIEDEIANKQITTSKKPAVDLGCMLISGSDEQGIVHMVGPEHRLRSLARQSFVP